MAAVKEFDLADDLDRLPTELAFGRRLVAMPRAIAAEPSVLLLDEPAAGLDERETDELGNLIVRLAKEWGIAVLLIEHDVGLVLRVCDRVEALDFGRSIASGTPAQIAATRRGHRRLSRLAGGRGATRRRTPPRSCTRPRQERRHERLTAARGCRHVCRVRRCSGGARSDPGRASGRGRRAARCERRGQVDDAAHAWPAPSRRSAARSAGRARPRVHRLHRRARRGLGLVTEERSVFMGLTAEANLRLGRGPVAKALDAVPGADTVC